MSVIVPPVCPTTLTLTPISGSPNTSITFPLIFFRVCATDCCSPTAACIPATGYTTHTKQAKIVIFFTCFTIHSIFFRSFMKLNLRFLHYYFYSQDSARCADIPPFYFFCFFSSLASLLFIDSVHIKCNSSYIGACHDVLKINDNLPYAD